MDQHASELAKYNEFDSTQIKEKYNDLAANYDQTLVDVVGYPDPVETAAMIADHLKLPKDIAVIDFGCGTGLVGQELKKKGFGNITGTDASDGMLKEAAKKQAYSQLIEFYCCRDEVREELVGKFDVACSAGLMAHDHVDGRVLDEKIASLKPDSPHRFIMFTTRESYLETLGYGQKIKELEEAGKIQFVVKKTFERYANTKDQEVGRFKPVEVSCFVYKAL